MGVAWAAGGGRGGGGERRQLLLLIALFYGLVFLLETRGHQLLYVDGYSVLSAICGVSYSVLFRKTVPCYKHHP